MSWNEVVPSTCRTQSGATARSSTSASSAVRFTGTDCGPRCHCRMAKSPIGSSGVTVWPAVVRTTAPIPAPVAASTPRREMAGVGGAGRSPATLCDAGFSSHGISVSTSASATSARSP